MEASLNTEDWKALIAAGETLRVEFKSERQARLSDRELVETVACMANRDDEGEGWVLVGVEDDGEVTGALPRHQAAGTDALRVQALVSNRTRPALAVQAERVALAGKDLLAIRVPRGRAPVGTADGRYLRRALGGDGKPACVPFHFHEMNARQADLGVFDYSALELPGAGLDTLDPLEFARYRRAIREHRGGDEALLGLDDLELAKALGAVKTLNGEIVVRVLGLLLFGREEALAERLPTHELAFQALTGTTVDVNEFFRWPVLRALEAVEARAQARRSERELMLGMERVGIPNVSPSAFREALANALTHRDYIRLGAVHVQWRADEISISNPGGLPDGVRLGNLLVTPPRPRNPLLADALKRAGIVERTARGVDLIFAEQVRCGHPAPRYETDGQTGVNLTLVCDEPDLDLVRLRIEEERRNGALTLPQLLLVDRMWRGGEVGLEEAATLTQREAPEASQVLAALVDRGLCRAEQVRGRGRWRLSAATAQSAHPTQEHAAAVLAHVRRHGQITRGEAATLCEIAPRAATRLLRQLCESGTLQRMGERRWTRYELA